MWSKPKMNFWGEIDKAFRVNLIRWKYRRFRMLIIRLKSERKIEQHKKTGDKPLKMTRRHNKVVKIYDNSLRCHLKSIDIKFKWHAVFGFQFALLTCFESDFDDAHECHPFSIIFHLWCQIFCSLDESLNVDESSVDLFSLLDLHYSFDDFRPFSALKSSILYSWLGSSSLW